MLYGAVTPVPTAHGRTRAAHDAARRCAYVIYFVGNLAWGVFAVPSTFFLEQVGDMSSATAASASMYSSVAWHVGQFAMMPVFGALGDQTVGRRSLVLLGCGVEMVGALALVYPDRLWCEEIAARARDSAALALLPSNSL